jgi:ATP-dependent helicase/nuclease subunit A
VSAPNLGTLTIVGASAGSGKTHELTGVVVSAVDPHGTDPVDLDRLVAVTYTRRAAGELAARIRRTFVTRGEFDSAQRLPLAYIGTVHAVCLRLVKEFALDGGLSPDVDVLPGGEARLLQEALERGLAPALRSRIQDLANALEIRWDPVRDVTDWITPVQDIMTLARGNRIRGEALPAMAERSARRLLELIGPPEPDGDALDADFLAALEAADRALAQVDDGQKNTQAVREQVQDTLAKARRSALSWSDWVRLQKAKPGKSALAAVAPLNAAASRVDHHPRLHAQLREFTLGVYEAARLGLDAYDEWKRHRRVVDFVDMVDRALTLTESPEVRSELSHRLRLSVVDEFQDTSPLQLALFVRLHELAGRSTWVGDRKQCIFEYAGADPTLMEGVTAWVRDSGGVLEHLTSNWRSRPVLVDFFSRVFSTAFARHGYPASDVHAIARREADPGLDRLPPLGSWWLDAKSIPADMEAIAHGVQRLLDDPQATPVLDPITKQIRHLEPGDICVLVATNAEAEMLATALAAHGVNAGIARAGVLSTPEGVLVSAGLQYLLDRRDTLSASQIDALTGFDRQTPDAWLGGLISAHLERQRAIEGGEEPTSPERSTRVSKLEALRPDADALAPSEILDRVLSELDVAGFAARWPDPKQRLGNIDALRGLAAEYEEWCARQREAATLAGLLRFLELSKQPVLVRDEELASDNQHVTAGRQTVTISTYHRSKGLEWPVVILASLDRDTRRDAFEVSPETDGAAFDPSDPLGNRWVRYWPEPFGVQKKSGISALVAASPEGVAVAAREARERVRLLYVGFTRARDHLIVAARVGKQGPKTTWLDELCDERGEPLLTFPDDVPSNEETTVSVRRDDGSVRQWAARHWLLSGISQSRPPEERPRRWVVAPDVAQSPPVPHWIAPSRAATDWPELPALAVIDVASTNARLPLGSQRGVEWDVVGNTLHRFLAADAHGLAPQFRLDIARRLLTSSGLLTILTPESLVQSGDSLRSWVDSRWPGAIWQREVSIDAHVATSSGRRRIRGTIDLLLDTPQGSVIIDHKTYPGAMNTWSDRAATFAPQLAAYSEALRAAERIVSERWVSFAIAGGVVRLG